MCSNEYDDDVGTQDESKTRMNHTKQTKAAPKYVRFSCSLHVQQGTHARAAVRSVEGLRFPLARLASLCSVTTTTAVLCLGILEVVNSTCCLV